MIQILFGAFAMLVILTRTESMCQSRLRLDIALVGRALEPAGAFHPAGRYAAAFEVAAAHSVLCLGDARARLAVLGQHDLSFDEATVNVIVKAIRDDLPKKLLGKVMVRMQASPLKLIEALSSTRSETVESLFSEIAQKFPDEDVGRVAAAALEHLSTTAKQGASAPDGSSASLTGDLQFFGLPALLQSLGDNQATGIVTLSSRQAGQTTSKILFIEGKFGDDQTDGAADRADKSSASDSAKREAILADA